MADQTTIELSGQEVRVSHPAKVIFPDLGVTKLDLIHYYAEVAPAAVPHLRDRPTALKRFPAGAAEPPFFQKRIPDSAPEWLRTTTVTFPSGRTARELLPNDAAHLAWGVQQGVIDWNPWQARLPDLDHPDELRVDLDPSPQTPWDDVRQVALIVNEVLSEYGGLTSFPKTSGSRGIHVYVRIQPEHDFIAVRRAAVALAREVERRAPERATSSWWKEERHGRVFIDYNQNARDRTVASAYSVRPTPDARVSTPLRWDEVADVEPAELRIDTVPARIASVGDPSAEIETHTGSLGALLALAHRDEEAGLPDAPWPPNFRKMPGEARRVAPSREAKGSVVPELPEAERARKTMERVLHRTISGVDDHDTYVCRPHPPGEIAAALTGYELASAHRRGKFLWLTTDDGPTLGLHLGMAGRMLIDPKAETRWDRFTLRFEDGSRLVLRDKRRLGRAILNPDFSHIGPDAAEISRDRFRRQIGTGDTPLKARLLDQGRIAGVGNLLADETLWQAHLAPGRRTGTLSEEELDQLRRALRAAIRAAIRHGGVHTGTFVRARKRIGSCPRDGHALERATIGGRTTYWCPACQH